MAHGTDAARDLQYGRRGGRWAGRATGQLAQELALERTRHLDRHHDQPCDQKQIDKGDPPRCRWCHPDLATHAPDKRRPTSPLEWEGAARMAAARHHAGLPLTPLAAEALDRHPTPARLTKDGYQT